MVSEDVILLDDDLSFSGLFNPVFQCVNETVDS